MRASFDEWAIDVGLMDCVSEYQGGDEHVDAVCWWLQHTFSPACLAGQLQKRPDVTERVRALRQEKQDLLDQQRRLEFQQREVQRMQQSSSQRHTSLTEELALLRQMRHRLHQTTQEQLQHYHTHHSALESELNTLRDPVLHDRADLADAIALYAEKDRLFSAEVLYLHKTLARPDSTRTEQAALYTAEMNRLRASMEKLETETLRLKRSCARLQARKSPSDDAVSDAVQSVEELDHAWTTSLLPQLLDARLVNAVAVNHEIDLALHHEFVHRKEFVRDALLSQQSKHMFLRWFATQRLQEYDRMYSEVSSCHPLSAFDPQQDTASSSTDIDAVLQQHCPDLVGCSIDKVISTLKPVLPPAEMKTCYLKAQQLWTSAYRFLCPSPLRMAPSTAVPLLVYEQHEIRMWLAELWEQLGYIRSVFDRRGHDNEYRLYIDFMLDPNAMEKRIKALEAQVGARLPTMIN